MKQLFIVLTLLTYSMIGHSQEDESKNEVRELATRFIKAVKSGNKANVAKIINFPLGRYYPIPYIMNEQEFIKRYNEIFDDSLVKRISESDPEEDWAAVGWRGIMMDRGTVWLNYSDGQVLAINYHSRTEEKIRSRLIQKDRESVHASLRQYKEPVLIMETKKYRVRVDELNNGKYRYASWTLDKNMSMKPDIIVSDGEVEYLGSGGNHHYRFKSGKYTYECDIIILGSGDDPPAYLNVYEAEKEEPVLSQRAVKLLD